MAQQYFSRNTLSGANYGAGIRLTPLASPTTAGSILIHKPTLTDYDEIWLYAANEGTASGVLALWWAQTMDGGSGNVYGAGGYGANSGSKIEYTILPTTGLTLVIPGLILAPGTRLNGASSGTNSNIAVYGFVNHVGPVL